MNATPAPPRAPIKRRPAALTACAVLAVMLNAGAIGLATQASARWQGVAASASENPRSVSIVLLPTPAQLPDEPAAPAALAAPPPIDAPVVTPRLPRPAPLSPPTARTAAATEATEPAQPVLFYTYREVDTPAFPESDWNLDVGILDEIGVQRLVFEVLVSDHGQVVGCTVLQPADLADDVKRSLEKRLSETSLLPALRAGQLVASVRRIELLVAAAPPAGPAEPAAHRP
jgi:hypothetical protein